jgi:D-3-phosphoglycerate dehydrogenase
MKPNAMLINTSRASVVDEPALIAALKEKKIRAAAVDVYENEPAADAKEITSPLADVANLYGTHHIGASTDQAQTAVAEETVRIVAEFKKTGRVRNCVNP